MTVLEACCMRPNTIRQARSLMAVLETHFCTIRYKESQRLPAGDLTPTENTMLPIFQMGTCLMSAKSSDTKGFTKPYLQATEYWT